MRAALRRRDLLGWAVAAGGVGFGPRLQAHEYFVPTLRISHPWCRATPVTAPWAAVFMTFDEVRRPDRLVRAETPLAAAVEVGGRAPSTRVDIEIPEGRDTELSESGVFLRLVGLTQALELGRSYPLLLSFAQGGDVQATIDVAYVGQT